jgi:FeS assembly SUF system protein
MSACSLHQDNRTANPYENLRSIDMQDREFPPGSIEARVVEVLKTCYDPEIPVDIFELGLIYDIQVTEDRAVKITMTLTSPACPMAGTLPPEVQHRIKAQVEGISDATVDLVWDPPWNVDMMSEGAKLQLGMM